MDTQLQFNIKNLAELDNGKPNGAINHAITQIVHDVKQRANDKAKRKVNIQIEARPILDPDSGVLDSVGIVIQVKTTVPVRKTTEYPMLAQRDDTLLFSPNSPLDPRQGSLFKREQGHAGAMDPADRDPDDMTSDEDDDDLQND